jgi:hypothetical protein
MKMRQSSPFVTCAIFAVLTGCGGGGGGGSSGSVPVINVPAPPPTPTPSPSSAPVHFTIGAGSALIGDVTFDVNGNGIFGDSGTSSNPVADIMVTTNRDGQFGRAAIGRLTATEPPAAATSAIEGGGLDATTGYLYTRMRAPAGATALSPVTTLLASIDADSAAANLGLGQTARQLATFSAVPAMSSGDAAIAALGRRITALNLKLAAQAAIDTGRNALSPDGAIIFFERQAAIGERLTAGQIDLNDEASIRAILDRTSTGLASSADGRQAAAQLLARFGTAVDAYLTGPDRVAPIQHGLRLIVLPEILDLFRGNSPDPAAARAITVDMLLTRFREFSDIPAPTLPNAISSGTLIAVTDFRSIGRMEINDTVTLDANCSNNRQSPVCNDAGIGSFVSVGDAEALSVTSVRLPAAFAAMIAVAQAADGRIVMRRLAGATGLVWFEYDLRAASGLRATGRVYVRLGGAY